MRFILRFNLSEFVGFDHSPHESENKLVGIEQTLNTDGSIMEDRGELTRRE
jgi:hypothetical protein